jgi:nitroreductase
MDVLEALRTRRSIGKLTGDVSDEDLRTLVEAGLWAPNHKLSKPWRFTAVRGSARERLGELWSSLASAATTLQGDELEAFRGREARKPLRAPLLLVVSTRTDADPVRSIEDFAATSAAVQNVLLAAHALGFGAIWRTGAMAYRTEVNEFLGLDPSDKIVGIVYVGRPAMEPPQSLPRDVAAALRIIE